MQIAVPNREETDERVRERFREGMILTVEPNLSGAENMRRDEQNAQTLREDEQDLSVFVRFYSWSPWCLSLGANQKESDINAAAIQTAGLDLVRRATGGRAVLHADELTYSIVMRLPPMVQVHDLYRLSHELLRDGLEAMGAQDIVFQKSQPNFAQRYRTEGDSVSCFTSAARSEIMWQSRKVVGSAQRVWSNVLLQHGSILLGRGHEQLASFVHLANDEARIKLLDSIQTQSVSMEEICKRQCSFEECAEALENRFRRYAG